MKLSAKSLLPGLGLMLVVLAAYLNHFQNEFHFDDAHAIVGNVSNLKDLRNIPRFFTDATRFSILPGGQSWRPLVSTSLAIDYAIGHGLKPLWFHISTFFWFLLLLVLMWFLFRRIMDLASPHPTNRWTALVAAACYGLHPANAETVNYIVQRGEVYDTLGVVASLLWFIAYPAQRKYGWYLIPAIAAYLSKAPALIFPLILLAYIYLFEEDRPRAAILRAAPAFVVTLAFAILTWKMTPSTFQAGATSPWLYRFTQPRVALHYFKSFFLPTELTADSGWTPVSHPFRPEAVAGYIFLAGIIAIVLRTARNRETRPIAFGLIWFLLALLPTSLMALADVANDHRMFFPFVGLTLAVFWSLRLLLFRRREWIRGGIAATAVLLLLAAVGTHARNRIWRTEESLWRDVALKNPDNPRGLMSYGTALMAHGDYITSLEYFQRSERLHADDPALQVNMGITCGTLGRDQDAIRHFERAVALAHNQWEPYFYYGRWLYSKKRYDQAETQLKAAIRIDRLAVPARLLLMETYSDHGKLAELDTLTDETLKLGAGNPETRGVAGKSATGPATPTTMPPHPVTPIPMPQRRTLPPEALVQLASVDCRAGRYDDCLSSARKAIELRPNFAEAYNVMAMALFATNRGDQGIAALQQALRIKPDYEIAKKNLAWALEQKKRILGNR